MLVFQGPENILSLILVYTISTQIFETNFFFFNTELPHAVQYK